MPNAGQSFLGQPDASLDPPAYLGLAGSTTSRNFPNRGIEGGGQRGNLVVEQQGITGPPSSTTRRLPPPARFDGPALLDASTPSGLVSITYTSADFIRQ